MKFKVQLTPEIFDFPNLHSERLVIESYLGDLLKDLNLEKILPEWNVRFLSLLGKEGREIGVYKKGSIYSSELMKSYTIYIPIPTNEDVVWGVNKEKYAHRPPIDKNKMKMLNVKFTDFNNLSHYVVECSKIGILDLLKSGISLKGIKIKI